MTFIGVADHPQRIAACNMLHGYPAHEVPISRFRPQVQVNRIRIVQVHQGEVAMVNAAATIALEPTAAQECVKHAWVAHQAAEQLWPGMPQSIQHRMR